MNIFYAIEAIEVELESTRNGDHRQSVVTSNLNHLLAMFDRTNGLGLATLTKLLYFNRVTFEGYPCLILDSRIISVLQEGTFAELQSLRHIRYRKGIEHYIQYLRIMSEISERFATNTENFEQFLFLFGGRLKVGKQD